MPCGGDRDKCIAAGMDNYISKPLDASKLIRLLERLAAKFPQKKSLVSAQAGPESNELEAIETKNQSGLSPHLSESSQQVIDMHEALKRVGNDPEILNSMVDYFFEDAPGLLQEISHQAEVGDIDELTRAAHSLKGLCANFNAHAATQAAKTLEDLGHQGDLKPVPEAIPVLRTEVDRLTQELTQWQSDQ